MFGRIPEHEPEDFKEPVVDPKFPANNAYRESEDEVDMWSKKGGSELRAKEDATSPESRNAFRKDSGRSLYEARRWIEIAKERQVKAQAEAEELDNALGKLEEKVQQAIQEHAEFMKKYGIKEYRPDQETGELRDVTPPMSEVPGSEPEKTPESPQL